MKTRVVHAFLAYVPWMDQKAAVNNWWRMICFDLKFKYLAAYSYKFENEAHTHVCVIGESHMVLHTWPEHGYAEFVLYSCKRFDYMKLVRRLKDSAPHVLMHDMSKVEHPPTAEITQE